MDRPVYVLGAGALGSVLGALLGAEAPAMLVARPAHVAAIRRQGGLRLTGERAGLYAVEAVDRPVPPPPGALVLVTVKAFDLDAALRALAPHLDDRHLVVVLQNGLGVREHARAVLGREVVRAVTFMAAAFERPGEVALNAIGKTYLPQGCGLQARWEARGIPAVEVEAIATYVWRKLAINAVINPLSALLGVRNGDLLPLLPAVRPLVSEVVEVAAREGQTLEVDATLAKVGASIRQTARNRSSMLQDLRAGRRTEIEWINGRIVERGERHGVAVPCNRLLLDMVRMRAAQGASGGAPSSDPAALPESASLPS